MSSGFSPASIAASTLQLTWSVLLSCAHLQLSLAEDQHQRQAGQHRRHHRNSGGRAECGVHVMHDSAARLYPRAVTLQQPCSTQPGCPVSELVAAQETLDPKAACIACAGSFELGGSLQAISQNFMHEVLAGFAWQISMSILPLVLALPHNSPNGWADGLAHQHSLMIDISSQGNVVFVRFYEAEGSGMDREDSTASGPVQEAEGICRRMRGHTHNHGVAAHWPSRMRPNSRGLMSEQL